MENMNSSSSDNNNNNNKDEEDVSFANDIEAAEKLRDAAVKNNTSTVKNILKKYPECKDIKTGLVSIIMQICLISIICIYMSNSCYYYLLVI